VNNLKEVQRDSNRYFNARPLKYSSSSITTQMHGVSDIGKHNIEYPISMSNRKYKYVEDVSIRHDMGPSVISQCQRFKEFVAKTVKPNDGESLRVKRRKKNKVVRQLCNDSPLPSTCPVRTDESRYAQCQYNGEVTKRDKKKKKKKKKIKKINGNVVYANASGMYLKNANNVFEVLPTTVSLNDSLELFVFHYMSTISLDADPKMMLK